MHRIQEAKDESAGLRDSTLSLVPIEVRTISSRECEPSCFLPYRRRVAPAFVHIMTSQSVCSFCLEKLLRYVLVLSAIQSCQLLVVSEPTTNSNFSLPVCYSTLQTYRIVLFCFWFGEASSFELPELNHICVRSSPACPYHEKPRHSLPASGMDLLVEYWRSYPSSRPRSVRVVYTS